MGGVIVKPRSRILHGHDWVYASELLKVFGNPEDGAVVSIRDGRDRFLGSGIFHSASHLPVRRFSRRREDLDADFFCRRVRRAWEWRVAHGLTSRPCRAVWSESDGLPGVIVDFFDGIAVVQISTLAMELRKDLLFSAVQSELRAHTVVEKSAGAGRAAEGLPACESLVCGQLPASGTISFCSSGVVFHVDLLRGHKTGFYLDQLDSYPAVAAHAKGRRVLDCFSNQGGFALACACAGASSVVAVEFGAEAVEAMERNIRKNSFPVEVTVEKADVFETLRKLERRKEQFDLVILDPPSFARGKSASEGAMKGYRELHLRAASILAPGGLVASFGCSHHVGREQFLAAAAEGFSDARRNFRVLQSFSQPLDHPVLLNLPESEYLKGYLFESMAAF